MRNLKKRKPLSSNILNPGAPKSAMELAKLNKELIAANKQALLNPVIEPIVKCGIDNPCKFGLHNKKFNKNILNTLK